MAERIHLTPEEWNKFREVYLEEFEHAPRTEAFANACRRIRAEGGRVPSFKTLLRKLGGTKAPAQEQEQPASPESPTRPTRPTRQASPKNQAPDDYRSRLELVVRLYRTRSESACDAICDRLLPELEV